jgi:uncharacterized protein YjbI with pentapeptide repeats
MPNTNIARQTTRITVSDRHITQAELEAFAAGGELLDFDGCSFIGTRFDGLCVSGWHFYGCDFDAVSFAQSKLSDVRWFGCQGRNASFRGARLERARFKDSLFAMTDWDESVLQDGVFDAVDLRDAWFAGASLQDVAMFETVGVDLTHAQVNFTQFHATRQQDCEVEDSSVPEGVASHRLPAGACCFSRLLGSSV